ncbi:YacL family protein [Spongorhabdus nitratireducens]
MEYQFRRDLFGRADATFSMGHEAIGSWLLEEVGTRQSKISELLNVIANLKEGQGWESIHEGEQFNLTLTRDSAEVRADLLDTDMLPDDSELDYYDDESCSHCGLDDFQEMLIAWRQFIQEA